MPQRLAEYGFRDHGWPSGHGRRRGRPVRDPARRRASPPSTCRRYLAGPELSLPNEFDRLFKFRLGNRRRLWRVIHEACSTPYGGTPSTRCTRWTATSSLNNHGPDVATPAGRHRHLDDWLYRPVADDIDSRIASDEMAPGTRIRPERELVALRGQLRSRSPCHKDPAEELGLIVTQRGGAITWSTRAR